MIHNKQLPCGSVLSVEFTPQGRKYFLNTTDDQRIPVWDTSTLHQCVLIEAIAYENKCKYEDKVKNKP